jgi:GH35 family endo-1,4-beta-xylanase
MAASRAVTATCITLLFTLLFVCDAALILPDGSTWGLKQAYNGTFKFGVSTHKNSIFKKEPTKTTIKDNYDVLLTETDLIWTSVEYQDGQWFFDDVDDYVEWAEKNGMEPIGMKCVSTSLL